jgi:hypothetical protein
MNFLEKDLENIVWEADNIKLQQKNLPIEGKKIRQLKIGNYGISDIVTYERQYLEFSETSPYLKITIYELKKEKIGISAFLQSLKYAKGIKTYMEEYRSNIDFTINIVLCAKDIDLSGEFIYITDLMYSFENFGFINKIDFYTFEYLIDGINFIKHENYNLTHKGF